MYKEAKYTLDFLFLFMLVLSIILFSIGFFVDVQGTALDALYKIDVVILGGYYAFFLHGLYKSKSRTEYCKQHWIMLALLILSIAPIARLFRLVELERAAAVGTNAIWKFFDELKLL